MLMLVEALLVRSALLVTHDHPSGPDGIGPSIGVLEDVEVRPLPLQGQAYGSTHGLLTAIGLDQDYRPRDGMDHDLAVPVRAAFVPREPVGPVAHRVAPRGFWVDRAPGLRSTVLRL